MLKRGNALAALPRDPYTALLLTSFPAVRYYAGKEAAEGSALLAWSGGCILLPSFSSEKKSGFAQIRRAIPKTVSTLEAEPSALTAADWMALRDALPIASLSEDLEKRVYLQRCHKDPEEIQKIRQAQQITERAFTACLNDIRPGMTDRELQKRIADHLWAEGSEMTSFNHVLGCGPDTVNPHVRPTGRRIARGDLIMMDIGAQVEGYGSDMTRMIAVGEPGEEERRIYELVLAAQTSRHCGNPGRYRLLGSRQSCKNYNRTSGIRFILHPRPRPSRRERRLGRTSLCSRGRHTAPDGHRHDG